MRTPMVSALAVLLVTQTAFAQQAMPRPQRPGRVAAPTAVTPATRPLAPLTATKTASTRDYDPQRLMAGHVLRRIGFGPNPADMARILQMGTTAYIDEQLNPTRIDDSVAESKLPPGSNRLFDDYRWIRRWYARMALSKRQLLEKMTLIWHEHFSVSDSKVGEGFFMHQHEDKLRANALGSFPEMLRVMTRDKAMLYFLDNNYNSATYTDDAGNPIPPNENYARELMQLYSLGTEKLRMDGTVITDANGEPLPNYTEDDVKAVARALSGWYANYRDRGESDFAPDIHDSHNKQILGETLVGRSGQDGQHEVDDVVAILMRQPSLAPFISKELILKLATETPTPGYVERVATVFKNSNGDIKATVRAILTDPEFTSPEVVRSQFKTPIEQYVGAIRGMNGKTKGAAFIEWCIPSRHLIYYPPSVFSFYRPGQKGSLVNTALATIRDSVADQICTGYYDTSFDAVKLIRKNHITTPEQAVDFITDSLLSGPIADDVRARIISYMDGRVDEEKFRGAVWLVLVSPDFQRN